MLSSATHYIWTATLLCGPTSPAALPSTTLASVPSLPSPSLPPSTAPLLLTIPERSAFCTYAAR
uniref:Uncharacterized protein n=1 Tax=Oryza barthii TaxID=65489 RepID=A0A0D3F4M0_9ORYZ